MKAIKLGFAPTQRPVFDKQEAIRHKKLIQEKMADYSVELITIDTIVEDGLLNRREDAEKISCYLKAQHVDALFIPHCDFGTEAAVARVAQSVGVPTLIWGPRDDAPLHDGSRARDTQCGIFASTKVLSIFGAQYTYITNSRLDDKVFQVGFKNFLSAARVVKAFKTMRVGQISTRPDPFYSVIMNEGELLEKFGIEVIPTTLVDIERQVKILTQSDSGLLRETMDIFRSRPGGDSIDIEEIKILAALKLTILDWAAREKLSGASIQCWSALQSALGIVPCFVNGELTGEGFPIACESDIYGAVTSVMAQSLTDDPVFFADLTIRHPKNDNAELLWHCGNFPYKLAANNGSEEISKLGDWNAIGNWELRHSDVTLCRFGGMRGEFSLLMGHAKSVDGPYNSGTYLWVEFKDLPLWEHKFVRGPYIHHCTGIFGEYAPALYEACRYIPGLSADAVEPDQNEIEKIWRG
ncbi:MAG: fucose isomerase [Clostridiales bacterium]|nr:fucose isomerase [Clostridiales bacterium]